MAEKYYPGGFRLTLKTARALAVQELGTARGLKQESGMPKGYYHIVFGNLEVQIQPDTSESIFHSSSRIIRISTGVNYNTEKIIQFFDLETLKEKFEVEEKYKRRAKREALEQWVYETGPEPCHELVDEVWNTITDL